MVPQLFFPQVEKNIDSLKALIKQNSSDSVKYKYLIDVAKLYDKSSKLDSAEFYLKMAIETAKSYNNFEDIANAYLTLGNAFLNQYKYEDAFKNYSRADSICDNVTELRVSKIRGRALNFMGYAVRLTHDYDKAGEYYNQAKDVYEKLNYEVGVQEVNVALGQLLMNKKDYDEALKLLNEAVVFHERNGKKNPYTYAVICRGYLLVQMKDFDKAEVDYQTYYTEANKTNNKVKQLRALSYLGYFYSQKGDFKKSVEYYSVGYDQALDQNNLFMQEEMQRGRINALKKIGDSDKLSEAYEEYLITRNKLDSVNKNSEIYDLETKYQTQKKEQEIALLTTENELEKQKTKNQRTLMLGGLAFFVILGSSLYYLYRQRTKVNRKLVELDEAKSQFFVNVSHELRTPLSLISAPLEQELKSNSNKNLDIAFRNTKRLNELVDQILDLSQLEAGAKSLNPVHGMPIAHVISMLEGFRSMAEQNGLDFSWETNSESQKAYYDKDALSKIVSNLMANAIKYSDENGWIKCKSFIENGNLIFELKNSGKPISSEDQSKIFERFYRADRQAQGLGLGLPLVKELVQLHQGSIQLKTTSNSNIFLLKLSVDAKVLNIGEDVQLNEENIEDLQLVPMDSKIETNGESPSEEILLICDDNEDIQNFIGDIFSEEYKVIKASNGQEGIDAALEHVPDLVLTDLMMPVKDGIELCEFLKNDEKTSHIPIIMLTAKAGEESTIEGLETGADDYITKPFNVEILKLKVKQQVDSRRKLRERYSQELVLLPKDVALNSIDEQFFIRLEKVMEDHLVESDFTAEKFSEAMGMSRMQLHRKLKALTGLSTTEFIRNQRLKLAVQLLQKGEVAIGEVGYAVGFNNHSYFSKCFKETYGSSPSEYLKSL